MTKWIAFWKSIASKAWPERKDLPLWQQQYWDTKIREGRASEKWDYVVQNPVRAGLVAVAEDWPYQGEMDAF